ncbi:potassium-transporting ATPase subunit KdpB [Occallatibacter riparius]|uniref:Potassium-transporting ATPase ATP-binding subunit n=2 Tax=Occallatibacter riparius TaxID=1002689 RepID=A0A9J7BXC0_9BACT|nr:potassium-transporting ATPase subunit KdpB [Occallatibacter riparius]UWZ85773.1 potassium-transporting ATPase subunit KdpB [Occallatibacter riparius]
MPTMTVPTQEHKPEQREHDGAALISKGVRARPLFDPEILKRAIKESFVKLNPMVVAKNPVMFVVEVGAALTTVFVTKDAFAKTADTFFGVQIALWLWFTVLFANFAEAMAEARGKAQADALRKTKTDAIAHKILPNNKFEKVPASSLRAGDTVYCEAGQIIPGDGEVIEGIASVDESVITGESAPVIRESGGDRSAVTGGTKVLSDHITIRITSNPGETFLDRMIALVEGAVRQKTPNEIALNILIAGLTLIFLMAVATLPPFAKYSIAAVGGGVAPSVAVLVSLLVCLIPTTIGGLLSAIGIAGMDRVMQHNVLAMSGKAVEASGDVNTLLLDKTGTITLGNRQAVEFIPVDGVSATDLADAAQLSSLADETPEGRSVVVLAKEKYGLRGREVAEHEAHFIPFSAYTRMSGVDIDGRQLRKGATEAIAQFVVKAGGVVPKSLTEASDHISRHGGTPLAVADGARVLGVIHLKDIVKGGMKERLASLRTMGIRSVMITGDNPLTAAAIAQEAGVDDFLAQATPKDKLEYIRKEQAEGRLVAMTGDGTNDAPALAQADVGVAMNTGTMAAKEAGNMVDLDSNPTKLIEIVAIGKQLLITRGSLTTFSIANDVAKYFAIIPAMFAAIYPELNKLNIMGLHSPQSAVLSAVIFNAVIIIALVPLALRGVRYKPVSAGQMLTRNLLIYGLGGIIAPFPGIWLIDKLLAALHLA